MKQPSINYLAVVVLLLSCFLAVKCAPQDLGSPIRIAQCRALCLDKFVRNDRHEKLCQQDPDCFTCWENCGLLQDNPTVWSRICTQPTVCFPGCLQACQFFRENADVPQKDPVMPTSAEPTVKLIGNLATWPRPSASSSGSKKEKERLVYAVIQKQASGRWRQIIQTAEEKCFLPSGQSPSSAVGNLRVLAVGGRGLVALYRPENEDSTRADAEAAAEKAVAAAAAAAAAAVPPQLILPQSDTIVDHQDADVPSTSTPQLNSDHKLPASPQWQLREVSLIHQKVLVIAEVAWPVQRSPDGQSADYLVTWEVDGGGLKGHLYTDSTAVTLSLWPDTVYHIQVELVTGAEDFVQLRSTPLTIDTHKAPVVTSEERPLPAAPLIDRLPSSTGSGRRLEATVGVGAAAGICLFLLVLATAIGIRRHRQATRSLHLAESQSDLNSSVQNLTVKILDCPDKFHQQPFTVHHWQQCFNSRLPQQS